MESPKPQEQNRPENEVIHEEWVKKYDSAGVSIPDIQEVLTAVETRDQNIVGENYELTVGGVKVQFPKTWQNGWAILEKVYSTVLESKKN